VDFPRAGADAGRHTAPLQTQKHVNDTQPQPRLCAVFTRLVSTLLEILVRGSVSVASGPVSFMFQSFLRF
jgi:hypothetical protein